MARASPTWFDSTYAIYYGFKFLLLKLPWKWKFQTFINCVGGVKSCRSTACHLSWPITSRLISISRPHTSNPRLQAVKTFWSNFAPLRIFSKMFLTTEIGQISPEGLFRPTLQSEKKTFGGQKKKAHSLFSGPYSLRLGSFMVKYD